MCSYTPIGWISIVIGVLGCIFGDLTNSMLTMMLFPVSIFFWCLTILCCGKSCKDEYGKNYGCLCCPTCCTRCNFAFIVFQILGALGEMLD
jgi:hypothetical protein